MILNLKGTYSLYDVNTSANPSFVYCSCVGVRTSFMVTRPYLSMVRLPMDVVIVMLYTSFSTPIKTESARNNRFILNRISFVVDLKSYQDPDDLKGDDYGHWIHSGRKSTRVAVWLASGKVVCVNRQPSQLHQMKTARCSHLYGHTTHMTPMKTSKELSTTFLVSSLVVTATQK